MSIVSGHSTYPRNPVRIVPDVALFAVLVGFTAAASAQADDDSLMTHELGEVYIQDGSSLLPVGVQRIPLAAWRAADALNVAEAARLIPAAHIATNSRGETLLTLRGASDRQVSVYLDGAPLTLAWDQRVDLGLLPSGVVGGGTVAKGNSAARFGANGYGGVLNLVSRELAHDGRLIEVDGVGSDPGLGRASAAWLERNGRWSSVVAVQRTESDGMALADDAGLAFSQVPSGLRTNSDYALTSVFSRVTVSPAAATRLGVTLLVVDGEKGVPPEGHVDPEVESVRFWRYPDWNYRALMLSGETVSSGVRLRGIAWGGAFSQIIERYDDVAYTSFDRTEEGKDWQAGTRISAERPVSFGTLRGIAGWQIADHDQMERQRTDGELELIVDQTYRESKWTLGAEADVNATSRLTFIGGVGGDHLRTHEAGDAQPSDPLSAIYVNGGANFRLTPGVQLQTSVGRRTRFPSMRERYDDALGRFEVNPDLKPESAWLFDVGLNGSARSFSAEAVLFTRRATGTIEVEVLPDGSRRRVNLGGSRAYGVEFVAAARLPFHLRADGHLTILHVRGFTDEESDLRLTETPSALGRVALSFAPPPGFTATIESEYVGEAFSGVSDGLARLDPSLVVNLRAGYRLLFPRKGLSLELFGRVNNVSDAVVLPQIGLPAAGRTILFGLSVAIG